MNQRRENGQQRRDDFQKNQEGRWENLGNSRNDRQDWRDQNCVDRQGHSKDMWDCRSGRAANTEDSLLCDRLGRHAAHAAMSGRTGLVIS